MRVLYVSKALTAAAYRDKLDALNRFVDVCAICPQKWGRTRADPMVESTTSLTFHPARLHGRNHWHWYTDVSTWFGERSYDLVHVDEEPYSAVTLQIGRACQARNIPFLFFGWQNVFKPLPWPFRQLRQWSYRTAAGAIAGSNEAHDVFIQGGYQGKATVIPQFGVNLERFALNPRSRAAGRRTLGLDETTSVVGFGGRLVREKGVEVLLAALAGLPGVHLVVIGDGPWRSRLVRVARQAGVADRMHWVGAVASYDMPHWLSVLDLLVLPTVGRSGWAEQFGRVLIEAMACSIPVVATAHGEIPNVVGDAGVLVPPGDVAALARAIGEVLHSTDVRDRLRQKGLRRVGQHFTQDNIAAQTFAFYQRVVPC